MATFSEIPVESWQWLFIGVVFCTVSIRSYFNYKKTTNQVSLFYLYIAAVAGFSYFFWGMPSVFTKDMDVIKYSGMVGDVLITIPVGAHAILLWMLVLKDKKISKWTLLIPSLFIALWSGILSVSKAFSGENFTHISDSGELLLGNLPSILSVLFIIIFYPLAVYFLRSASSAKDATGKMRGVALGLVYAGLATVEIQANSFSSSSQETERFLILLLMAIFGLIFFVIAQFTKKR